MVDLQEYFYRKKTLQKKPLYLYYGSYKNLPTAKLTSIFQINLNYENQRT